MDIYRRIRAAYGAYTGEKRVIGRSFDGRALFAFRMGEGRPLGIAVYAIHAREWVTALLALEHLKRSVSFGSVWFVPLVDPDGAPGPVAATPDAGSAVMRQDACTVQISALAEDAPTLRDRLDHGMDLLGPPWAADAPRGWTAVPR